MLTTKCSDRKNRKFKRIILKSDQILGFVLLAMVPINKKNHHRQMVATFCNPRRSVENVFLCSCVCVSSAVRLQATYPLSRSLPLVRANCSGQWCRQITWRASAFVSNFVVCRRSYTGLLLLCPLTGQDRARTGPAAKEKVSFEMAHQQPKKNEKNEIIAGNNKAAAAASWQNVLLLGTKRLDETNEASHSVQLIK